MAKLTKQEFIEKVLTFKDGGKNAYGYFYMIGSKLENGEFIAVANKKDKILFSIHKQNNEAKSVVIFNTKTQEFHRINENTAEQYL